MTDSLIVVIVDDHSRHCTLATSDISIHTEFCDVSYLNLCFTYFTDI